MKNKIAFITGITGQDGSYLAKYLLEKGYKVVGGVRRSSERSSWRLAKLGILDKVELVDFDLLDYHNMLEVIKKYQFDEVYNLAAQSFVGTSFKQPLYALKCNGLAVCELVDIIYQYSPHTKFYQASTSEMFGEVKEIPQDEETPFNPSSPYAVAKLMAHSFVEMYRKSYGFFGCCGILFNHESPLRGDEFVTKKITNYVRAYRVGAVEDTLKLGNIDSERDWGFSGDYIKAMYLMMQLDRPDTYVIGTGKKYKVRDFVEMAFNVIGITIVWEGEGVNEKGKDSKTGEVIVEISKEFFRPNDVALLIAHPLKAKKDLGWRSETTLYKLVKMMIDDTV